ncbi:ClpS-like protein [Papiliotrema laurentii]|uniref:ClpS-like protein n=1 Tax=Papiliotrema laurentii TaxID=5418 RepID=A0AAD9FQE4_PAPLA|nr:ClpS-like protein [Papiliotrema laurentii]
MSRSCTSLLRAVERSAASSRSIRPSASSICRSFSSSQRRFDSPAPADQPGPSTISPKIAPIVDSISSLTLLEVSELVTALKERLNITEIAMPSATAPAAAAPAAASEAPAEEKPKEKTIFTVKLEKIDAAQKAKVIREVKAIMPNMNLVEAKKFVESTPQVLKDNVPKEDAEKLKATLEALGATVSLS